MTEPASERTRYDRLVHDSETSMYGNTDGSDGRPDSHHAAALIAATLAVAEQARIANLLTAQSNNNRILIHRPDLAESGPFMARVEWVAEQVREGLGGPQIPDPRDEESHSPAAPGPRPDDSYVDPDSERHMEIEVLLIGGDHSDLKGADLEYRIWFLRDVIIDPKEDADIIAACRKELDIYGVEHTDPDHKATP